MVKRVLLYRTAMQVAQGLAAGTLRASSRYTAMNSITPKKSSKRSSRPHFDHRDRLILALYAQLRVERETREALEWAIENDAISPEVLQAMVSDPVPVIRAVLEPVLTKI